MASTNVGSIHYDLGLDTKKFDQATNSLGSKLSSVGSRMRDVGKTMTVGLTLPIVAGFGLAVKAASDLNETMNKVDVAFKDQAKNVKEWASTSLKSMGLARGSALDAAALFGDMSTSMGLNTKQAYKMSTGLVQLGADLASFKNISFERSQVALAGIYTGETEALKGLGIVMTETNLAAFAQSKGITGNIQDMTQAEKVNLRYAYVMSVTKNAQGDFARTFGSTANQVRYSKERVKELSAEFGQKLLPITGRILESLNKLLDKFIALTPEQQNFIIKVAGITAGLGPLLSVLGPTIKGFGSLVTTFKSLSEKGVAVGKIFGITSLVLAALAIVVYVAWKNWDKLRPTFDAIVAKLKVMWAWYMQYIMPALQIVGGFIANQFKKAWNDIKIAMEQARKALEPYLPQLRLLAKIIGAVVIVAFVIFIATIGAAIAIIVGIVVVVARLIGWFARLQGAVAQSSRGVINWLSNMQSRIYGIFANAGSWLFRAGASIMQGLINGITSKVSGVVSSVKNVLAKARDLLPFSPAKEGPFSGRGWTLYSGQSIMQGFAQGIKSMADLPKNAIRDAMGNVSANVNVQPSQIASGGMTIHGNVNIGDTRTADYFFARADRTGSLLGMGMAGIGENS